MPGATLSDRLRRELVTVVGADHVLEAPALRAGYEVDWTGRFRGRARAVVRPADRDQVAELLRVCAAAGVPLVPQGGNTGLVGGAVPRDGEVVLSLRRLDRVPDVEPDARRVPSIAVDAGATLASVQATAARAGLEVGVDLASRDGATIGGMVATDAGGIHVLARGRMRDQVLELEAAGVDGSRRADVADLVGSEGTLAVITGVTVRLWPRLPGVAVALVACPDVERAVAMVGALRQELPSLLAAELMLAEGLELVTRHLGVPSPFGRVPPVAVLLECRAADDPLEELAGALDATAGDAEVVAAADTADRRRLWTLREAHAEAIAGLGIPHKLDVWVPDAALGAFVERAGPAVAQVWPGARTIVFGHVGVGNLHVNVVGPPADDERVDETVLRLVADLGGDVAGEHGAGIAKRRWLELTRTPEALAAAAARKHAWDPAGILNPGVIAAAPAAHLPSAP